MAGYAKPLPTITEEGKPYWEGCKRHEFLLQRCNDCNKFQFPHRTICSHCSSFNVKSVRGSGKGVVYSFTTVYRPPTGGFELDVPYTVAIIELDEGPRMMSNVVGCKPEDVRIGMRVGVIFEDVTEEITLPKFKPIGDKNQG